MSMLEGFFTISNMVESSGKIYLKVYSPILSFMPRTQSTCKVKVAEAAVLTSLEAEVVVVFVAAVVEEVVVTDLTVFKMETKFASLTMGFGLEVVVLTSTTTTENVGMSIFALAVLRRMALRKATKHTTANQMAGQAVLAVGRPSLLSPHPASNYSNLGAV